MEYWDLYDANLKLILRRHSSDQPIPWGIYYLSVEVWPFDGQRFFLTKRSMCKKYYPGCWECTGGHVISGEQFLEAAQREVQEKLGIQCEEDQFSTLSVDVKDKHIVSVFMLHLQGNESFTLSGSEIETGKWFSLQEMESLHLDMDFVPHQFARYIEHVRKQAFEVYSKSKPTSIQMMLAHHSELCVPKRGLPDSGHRPDNVPFTGVLGSIKEAFEIYGDRLYTKKTVLPESVNNSLGSGSPLRYPPFPPAAQAVRELLDKTDLSQYAFPAGDIGCRRSICEYLHQEGFCGKITPDNLIFTDSTTHAFHLVLQMILRPGDVILFTSPTYGLFAFEPERLGGASAFLPLEAENGWLVDPSKLDSTIGSINEYLSSLLPGVNPPRVVAFFQQNPHNPTGKVMGKSQATLVKQIASVCRNRGVFLIDDILYRDLSFDGDNLALPAAHFEDEYQNVITLMGLSKCYGMAGMRAGIVVADEVLIRGIRNLIFQSIDSASHLNAAALAGAFAVGEDHTAVYNEYFADIRREYWLRLNLVIAAVRGIEAADPKLQQKIREMVVQQLEPDQQALWLSPMESVDFVKHSMPDAGFFCLLDFTSLRGKSCGDTVITDDLSLLDYLFSRYRINFITGKSIGWPDPQQIIMRVSFSCEPEKIIRVLNYLKIEIQRLQ